MLPVEAEAEDVAEGAAPPQPQTACVSSMADKKNGKFAFHRFSSFKLKYNYMLYAEKRDGFSFILSFFFELYASIFARVDYFAWFISCFISKQIPIFTYFVLEKSKCIYTSFFSVS